MKKRSEKNEVRRVITPEKNRFLRDEPHNSFYGIPLKKVLGFRN
jgi:hypothetical protein